MIECCEARLNFRMPQVWGLKPRLVSKSSALLRALSVHVGGDRGSGEEESCREDSEGFLN